MNNLLRSLINYHLATCSNFDTQNNLLFLRVEILCEPLTNSYLTRIIREIIIRKTKWLTVNAIDSVE